MEAGPESQSGATVPAGDHFLRRWDATARAAGMWFLWGLGLGLALQWLASTPEIATYAVSMASAAIGGRRGWHRSEGSDGGNDRDPWSRRKRSVALVIGVCLGMAYAFGVAS